MVAPVDVVIPVGGKAIADRLNLRYTLRGIETNLPWVRDVWIVGDVPDWLSADAHAIPVRQLQRKSDDVRRKVTKAMATDGLADTVLLMCDDQYILDPIASAEDLPVFHAGDAFERLTRFQAEHKNLTVWARTLASTAQWLRDNGYSTLSYAMHQPQLYDRGRLADVLAAYPAQQPLDVASLYPAAGIKLPGMRGMNAKVRGNEDPTLKRASLPWLSSLDGETFTKSALGRLVAEAFPGKSRWET